MLPGRIKGHVRATVRNTITSGRRMGFFPTRRFALICHQRSGSNMLTSILNQHPDVIMRGQILKDDPDYQAQLQEMGMVPFTGKLFDDGIEARRQFDRLQEQAGEREDRNARETVESFYHSQGFDSHRSVIGIKFHGGTLYRDEIEAIFLGTTPYDIILLHRENLLAAGISWYQARVLDQWVSKSEKIEKPTIEIDIPLLLEFVERTRDDIAEWKGMLEKHRHPYLELTYEQITSPDFSYDTIWNHLDVRSIEQPKPKTYKLLKDYQHISNIDAIREAFAGRELGAV
ncbi:sulfotransferase [Lewinella sp. IMCC34191]|uniref:sulfotransferase n=1 Tax=Lewinella sp. IMCC34191 TaxID=2259172 RepID=UPI000E25A52F|nr:sulfotransferase [Lewinella sp. IMCC34191]